MSRTTKSLALSGTIFVSALLLFSFSALLAEKTPPPKELLQKMVEANRSVSYRGDWVTETDSLQIWQKIYHDSSGRKRVVFLLPRKLLGREVLELPPFLFFRKKEGEKFRKRELIPNDASLFGKLGAKEWWLLRQNYAVSVSAEPKFLRRPVWKVVFQPQFPDRPSVSAWVDAQTFLLVRVQKTGPDGRVLQNGYFKNLLFDPILDPALFVLSPDQVDTAGFKKPEYFGSLDSLKREMHFHLILPGWLPEGFRFQMGRRLFFGRRTIVHLIYFDGLSTLSLFESRSRTRSKTEPVLAKKHGGVWELHTTAGSVGVSLFGDLPRPVLNKILTSFPQTLPASQKAGKNLVLWVGILIVFLILMTQFLTGKRRTR